MKCYIDPYEGGQKYAFFSFAHADEARVYPIIERLAIEGYRIWFDNGTDSADAGAKLKGAFLSKAAVLIIAMSGAAADSHDCRNELNFAAANNKPLLPIVIEDCPIPLGIQLQLSSADCVRRDEQSEGYFYNRLITAPVLKECKNPNDTASPYAVREWQNHLREYRIEGERKVREHQQIVVGYSMFLDDVPSGTTSQETPNKETTSEKIGSEGAETPHSKVNLVKSKEVLDREEARRKAYEDERERLAREAERLRQEEEARRKAYEEEQERLAREAERLRQEEEARRIAEEEARRRAEEEARRRAEEEARRKAEEEARRKAEEEARRRAEEEARRKAEEEARRRAEEEARRKAEEEARRKAEEEARRRAEEEARRRAEEEARRRAEEEARRKAEEEARRRAEEEARRKAEEEARRRAEEEARRKAEEQRRLAMGANDCIAMIIRMSTGEIFRIRNNFVRLGRSKDCDIVFAGNQAISRVHIELFEGSGEITIKNVSQINVEANGTVLRQGEVIALSPYSKITISNEECFLVSGVVMARIFNERKICLLRCRTTGETRMFVENIMPLNRYNKWKNNILGDTRISREHQSELVRKDGRSYLRDAGSVNGTFLNRQRLNRFEELELHNGDLVTIVETEFIYYEASVQ